MVSQKPDSTQTGRTVAHNPGAGQQPETSKREHYYADVPFDLLERQSDLIDHLIDFAFDTLGARSLEVRVRRAE